MKMQVVIHADARVVVGVGDPEPANRNDGTVDDDSTAARTTRGATVIADGAYRAPAAPE
nr:hypothetical protein [Cryptosporangium phraense]